MSERTPAISLDNLGVTNATIHWNLLPAQLVEHAVRRGEGRLAKGGPLMVETGKHDCRTKAVIAVSFTEKLTLIGGTAYAGEMKKSVFGLLNYTAAG